MFCTSEASDGAVSATLPARSAKDARFRVGILHAPPWPMERQGARNFRELRVWESARSVKKSLHLLTETDTFRAHERLCSQIREAAASAASHIAEGYGRFEPLDHARFLKMGKASLIECQNHLVDAMDRGLITKEECDAHDVSIQALLNAVGALIAYLQSPEAKKNAERIKRAREARRRKRREP